VTTTLLADSNGDGRVGFGGDKVLGLPGGEGTVGITGSSGVFVNSLEFDGAVNHTGMNYYVYSAVGSAAGVDDLLFA